MTALVGGVEREVGGVVDDGLAPPAWDRRRDRRAAALLFLLVWVVYLATATYDQVQINDNRSTSVMAWSLGTRGTIDLPQEWAGEIPWEAEGVDGALHTDRFPGAWLWAAPFHAVAGAFGDDRVPAHPALIDHAPSGVAAATATALGVLVSFLLFRRLADRRVAVGGALVLAFATGVWSVSADAMWTHGVTHLTLTLGLLAASSGRNATSGLAFALAVLTRPQVAVVPAVVGVWRSFEARSVRPALVIGATSALGVVVMVVYSRATFGTWLPIAGYSEAKVGAVASVPFTAFISRVGGAIGHPERGLLIYAPFLLVLVRFLPRGWRASEWWIRSGAVGGVVSLLVQLRANGFDGGDGFFGSRLTLEALVLSAPLLLRTWQVAVAPHLVWRRVTLGLVAVSFVLHAVGAVFLSIAPVWHEYWDAELEVICAEVDDPRCP